MERQQSVQFTVGYRWPVRLALTVSPGLAVSSLLLWVLSGHAFRDAANRAGYVLAISFGVMIFVLPLSAYAVHIILEFKRSQPAPTQPRARVKTECVPVPVPTRSRKDRRLDRETMGEKMERALAKGPLPRVGKALRSAGDRMVSAPAPKRQRGYAQEAPAIQVWWESPETSQMLKLYHITKHFFGKRVTRDDFRCLGGIGDNWQKLYAEYKLWVSDTGFGWVDVDGRGTITHWRYPEHELYASDRTLRRIAAQDGFKFPGEGSTQ